MNKNFDVIVIGGGVIGLSCAWRLAQANANVCLLERHCCGAGASNASLGVLTAHSPLHSHVFHKLHRHSLEMFPQFADELYQGTGIDPLYLRCGSLEILPSIDQYRHAEIEARTAIENTELAGQYQLISASELREIEPDVVCTEFGALFCPNSAQVAIDQLITALLKACHNAKVSLIEGCNVCDLLWEKTQIIGVRTNQGNYHCKNLLVAAGAWSPQISPIIEKYSAIEPVRGQGLMLKSPSRLTRHIIKWRRSYIVPQADQRLVLGSTTEFNVGFEQHNTAAGINEVLNKTLAVLPKLGDCSLVKCWAGLRPAGLDRKPYIGVVPGVTGLYLATGLYKIGYGFAPLTAQALAELITTGRTPIRIDAIPPRNYKA